jgi:hypothetical protein
MDECLSEGYTCSVGVTSDCLFAVYIGEKEANVLNSQNKIFFKLHYTDAPMSGLYREMIAVGC